MPSPDYSYGPTTIQYPEDLFITYCLISCFLLLCALPLITYFKSSIQQTFVCIENIVKHTYFYITYIFETSYGLYILWKEIRQLQPQDQHHQQVNTYHLLAQTLPPPEELFTEVREQKIPPPFIGQISPLQDLQQDPQVFDTEYSLNLHIPSVSIERIYSPPVIYNDRAFTEFVNGEERCIKFVNQDLTFLQSSDIPSTFSNVSHESAKVKESTCIRLPTCILTEDNNTSHTQIVEPALGFTSVEICHAQNKPKLTVQQLLEIESCKDTNFGWYIHEPIKKIPTPCQGGKETSRGVSKRANCVTVGRTST